MLLKYEDFCAGCILTSNLAHYLKLDLKVEFLQKRISSYLLAILPTEIEQLQLAIEHWPSSQGIFPLLSQVGYFRRLEHEFAAHPLRTIRPTLDRPVGLLSPG